MKEIFFNTIQEFNDFIGVKTLHPLGKHCTCREHLSDTGGCAPLRTLRPLPEGKQGLQIVIRQNRI